MELELSLVPFKKELSQLCLEILTHREQITKTGICGKICYFKSGKLDPELRTYLLFPLLDGELVLAEYLGREELLVGEVAGSVLVHSVVVAELGLHLVRGHQHRFLSRAVNVFRQNVAAHLGIGWKMGNILATLLLIQ